ncbi:MAG: nuclear transport factor 2 family protein [Oligoflexales bacterium]
MNTLHNTLSLAYLDKFFASDFEGLTDLFSENLIFNGPFVSTATADEYIHSLQASPVEAMSYGIIRQYEDQDSVCIIYQMRKGKVQFPVVQVFEFDDNKIAKITTIFDSLKIK